MFTLIGLKGVISRNVVSEGFKGPPGNRSSTAWEDHMTVPKRGGGGGLSALLGSGMIWVSEGFFLPLGCLMFSLNGLLCHSHSVIVGSPKP